MVCLLEKIDVGINFLNAIKGIYNEQKSYLLVNGENTKDFQICRGTRQGCQLSLLLFIFVLEVLLKKVQDHKEISGLKFDKNEYKYRAYAVMFYLLQKIQ